MSGCRYLWELNVPDIEWDKIRASLMVEECKGIFDVSKFISKCIVFEFLGKSIFHFVLDSDFLNDVRDFSIFHDR